MQRLHLAAKSGLQDAFAMRCCAPGLHTFPYDRPEPSTVCHTSAPRVQVHASVFAAGVGSPGRDARSALAAARRRVLAGVRLCFSGVVPLGAPDPTAHPLWRLAEEVRACERGGRDGHSLQCRPLLT